MASDDLPGEQGIHYEAGVPILEPPLSVIQREQAEAKRRDERYKDAQLKLDGLMVLFTGCLVFTAVLSGLISGYQANVAKLNAQAASDNAATAAKMLDEMKRSGADTHELAVAAADQVAKLEAGVEQTHALAEAARISNVYLQENDRPWIGVSLTVNSFTPGKVAKFILHGYNGGRRPANVSLATARSGAFPKFPINPDAEFFSEAAPSANFILPNAESTSVLATHEPLAEMMFTALEAKTSTYFVFEKIEYSDPSTGRKYWKHACFRYAPSPEAAQGFVNCKEYNDSK